MEIIHEWENGPEVIFIKNIDISDAKKEIEWMLPVLEKPEETGTAYEEDNKTPRKDNKGIFLDKIYTPLYSECSPVSKIFSSAIETIKKAEFTLNSCMNNFYNTHGYSCLVSAYKDQDYYKPHRDIAKMTMLLWLGKKNFEGGDLIFNDFDYTIPYEEGLMVVFPSYYHHEVTQVKTFEKGYVRYCATAFIQ